jgi:RNA polymerase sigma-70 factor (ECF subfamily)
MDGAGWSVAGAGRVSGGGASGGERSSLAAAQAGDEHAFVELTSPHRRALHVHCHRMLGSLHDADDAMQETLLRAWRGIGRFEPRAPLAAWLHRIATNVCLRMIEQRRDTAAYAYANLQPYPDRLLEDLAAPDAGPHDVTSLRESVGVRRGDAAAAPQATRRARAARRA